MQREHRNGLGRDPAERDRVVTDELRRRPRAAAGGALNGLTRRRPTDGERVDLAEIEKVAVLGEN